MHAYTYNECGLSSKYITYVTIKPIILVRNVDLKFVMLWLVLSDILVNIVIMINLLNQLN